MIIEETVPKGEKRVSMRLNELGLHMGEFLLVEWNPMNVILYYEKTGEATKPEEVVEDRPATVAERAAILERENAKLRSRVA